MNAFEHRSGPSHLDAPAAETLRSRVLQRRFYKGARLDRAVTIEDLRARTYGFLPKFALEYLEGGAEDEVTLQRNRMALSEYSLLPHALVDVSQRDISTRLFDRHAPMPLIIAPTGLNGLFRACADRMLAEAAAAAGIPFTQSTMSNVSMENVAAVPGLRHWWQLYVFGGPAVCDALVERADANGCEALVITTDAQIFGNREWSRRTFARPGRLSGGSLLDAALHPRWAAATILREGMPTFANIIEFVPADRRRFFDSASWVRSQMRADLDWSTVERIRRRWPRKLLVKGILRVDDVRRANAEGIDGIVLSNHGGRQLDGTVSPIDCLPRARDVVGEDMTLLVDGGIRRGADVVKAMALGADAVQIGRAALYGLVAGGRMGVERSIAILCEEMDRTLGLLGVGSFAALRCTDVQRVSNASPPAGSTAFGAAS